MNSGKIFNKVNTVFTIASIVYTVSKFMYDTFKKYEEKHSKKSDGRGTERNIQEGHEVPKKVSKRRRSLQDGNKLPISEGDNN